MLERRHLEHDPALCGQLPDEHARQNKGLERDATLDNDSIRSHPALGCALALMMCVAAAAEAANVATKGVATDGTVTLSTQPGSALEATALKLTAGDLKQSASEGDPPIMLVGSAHLSTRPGPSALFVQVQSASFCGSAGCSTSVYVKRGGAWKKVMDSISGPIKLSHSSHQGMRDLLIHGKDRWVWNGAAYTDTLPTPDVDLLHSTKKDAKP